MKCHRMPPANIHITPVIIPFEIKGESVVKYRLSLYFSLRAFFSSLEFNENERICPIILPTR